MRQLKFTGLAQVGDTIRGYDFEPRGTEDSLIVGDKIEPLRGPSYVEGVVVEECCFDRPSGDRCQDYKVKITHRFLNGKDRVEEHGDLGWIPHQVSIFEWDGRIQLIKKGNA